MNKNNIDIDILWLNQIIEKILRSESYKIYEKSHY